MKINVFVLFLISINLQNYLIKSEIVFVFEQFRNGLYKFIPLGATEESQNIGLKRIDKQITPSSMRAFYLLGLYIREKYKNIINRKITSKNLYMYSKELDIHVLTAQSQLLGMFPLEEGIILNQIEIDLAFPQTSIPLEAQQEINCLGNLSVPKSIKPFALRYFSDDEKQNLLSINNECPRLTKIKENNIKKEEFQNVMKTFLNKHGNDLDNMFNLYNRTLINDYDYLSIVIDHFLSYYKNRHFLEQEEKYNRYKLPKEKLDILFNDCIEFKNKSYLLVEATKDISIISMSATMKKLVKYMEERISYDQKYDETSAELNEDNTPKFLMYSNNGLSLYYFQVFLREAFGVELKYPFFASNQFVELHRKDGIDYKDLKEEDYHIEYYFNGELLLKIDFVDFKNKVNELEWSSRKINNFCKHKDANILDHMFYFSLSGSIFIILISIIRTKKAEERLKNLTEDKF
jgi:hypothetical protein